MRKASLRGLFRFIGIEAIDIHRLAQIADVLEVSLDWLMGRSNVMSVPEMPDFPEPEPPMASSPRKSGPCDR